MNKLYFIFCSIVLDDGTETVHSRTVYLLELFITLILISLTEILIGLMNIDIKNFFYLIILMIPSPLLAYYITKKFIGISKIQTEIHPHIEKGNKSTLQLKILAISLFIFSFVLIIFGGMFMSFMINYYNTI
jgi:hypothetical protein